MKKAVVLFPELGYSEKYDIKGYIIFMQETKDSPVYVEINLKNLPNGIHGIHIHEKDIPKEYLGKSNLPNLNICKQLGGHFNPFNVNHGSYNLNTIRHVGDLVNNINVKNNEVYLTYMDSLISLYPGKTCIINRSVVIHKDKDDEGIPGMIAKYYGKKLNKKEEESLKTGNAGNRIACGNIYLYKQNQ
jgi:Cu-Zn family superoxide dismutase